MLVNNVCLQLDPVKGIVGDFNVVSYINDHNSTTGKGMDYV